MTYSVYQHWDPLKVCVVGRSYPPEFYSWIKVPYVRELFEKIALETEEDFQKLITKLESFGVQVLRPDISSPVINDRKIAPPPVSPRDYTIMIGNTFYFNYLDDNVNTTAPFKKIYKTDNFIKKFYKDVRNHDWPECHSLEDFLRLPKHIQDECELVHGMNQHMSWKNDNDNTAYNNILNYVKNQGNEIKYQCHEFINGAMVSRIGQDLYFGTDTYEQDQVSLKNSVDREFVQTRNHVINTGGHGDATYCPVCPGLIISLFDVPTYAETFPGWEVVYLPKPIWDGETKFLDLKKKNQGKWWIPGFEYDQTVIDIVETQLSLWTGNIEETVFEVNMLIVDPKNVIVFGYNKQMFDALNRYGITPHIVTFRHRHFWDAGLHCVTSDLHREGTMQDYFPQRTQ